MKTFEGKCGIKVTVLCYSVSPFGVPMITFEIEYPRLILAELNTHRMLSRNSFSSRAVPFDKMLLQLNGRPVRFGANQAGMQDKGEDFDAKVKGSWGAAPVSPEEAWEDAKQLAIGMARNFKEAGYHKQVYNRLLEPFQMMKTVLSATELENFWWLRDDDAADPTIRELARVMREAMEAATPQYLKPGEWHLPYIDTYVYADGREGVWYGIYDEQDQIVEVTLDEAIKISCARCAAVSYRNEGYGIAKSIEVYDRLVGSDKKHASAFEHCATPMQDKVEAINREVKYRNIPWQPSTWQPGITHMDRDYQLWSGNLKGWIQYRKLIPGENYEA